VTTASSVLLYAVFAVGGAAVYAMAPKGEAPRRGLTTILVLAALGGFIAFLFTQFPVAHAERVCFAVFALIAVGSSARVITHSKPVYSAIYFVLTVVAVAAMLVLSGAEFLAAALVIAYAGAILVTYLFVIMLAQQPGSPVYDRRAREPLLAILTGFMLAALISHRVMVGEGAGNTANSGATGITASASLGNTVGIGAIVMTQYVVALEIAGLLLLMSMVGAIALSRKKVEKEYHESPAAALGLAGREAPPF